MSSESCKFPLISSGFLSIKSQNGFSIKPNPKKKRFVCLYARSSQGIERLEISDSDTDKNSRIVTLEDCIKINSDPSSGNLIEIVTKSGQLVFICSSDEQMNLWTKQLQSVAFNDKLTSFKRNSIVEYNELYCSSFSEGKFTCNLIPTDITIKNNMEPKIYTLELTTTEIQLKNYEDENQIVSKWPYKYIRKYGYRDGKFTFEAGRKCETGEGMIKLDHANPQEIFRCMSSKMKSMKKLLSSDSSENLESRDNPLNIALNLEAGSRSPLPSYINSPTSPDNDISHASLRGFLSSTDSINLSFLSQVPPTPPLKSSTVSIPNKPPRKTLHSSNSTDRINNNFHETLVQLDSPPTPPERNRSMGKSRDYECIENITEAWKTLGIGEVKHTEHVSTPADDELQEFVWQRSKSFNRNESKKISVVDINENMTNVSKLELPANDGSDYDRLEFFPTKNSKNSSNYKTIVPVIPPKEKKSVVVSDDYEIITPSELHSSTSQEMKDLQLAPSRMADDSYLGYGVLRKTSLTKSPNPIPFASTSSQQIGIIDQTNGLESESSFQYAIVSKPKRV